jgi:hypothetical protein
VLGQRWDSRSGISSLRDDIGSCVLLVFYNRACALILPFQTERAKVARVGNIFDILAWLGLIYRRTFSEWSKSSEESERGSLHNIIVAGKASRLPRYFCLHQQRLHLTNAILNLKSRGSTLPRDFRIRRTY